MFVKKKNNGGKRTMASNNDFYPQGWAQKLNEETRREKHLSKPERHMELLRELNGIYTRKNHDYGDSFHETFLEERFAMARIRLSDKLNRFKQLSRNASEYGLVEDESIRDTLMDLANYAIMTVLEIDDEKAGIK